MARRPADDNKNLPKLDQYPGLSEAMLDTVQLPLVVLNGGLRLIRANAAFFSHFKVAANDSIGRRLPESATANGTSPICYIAGECSPTKRCSGGLPRRA